MILLSKECGRVQPLTAQKLITGQVGGKEFLFYFRILFIPVTCRDQGEIAYRNSTVSSDSHLQIGHQWIDQHHLDHFRYS